MISTNRVLLALSFCFSLCSVLAQEATVTSGGEATGDGGNVSFSVGQVSYTGAEGDGGSLSEGVQQAYEIYINVGVEEIDITLNVNAFPNPTRDLLSLQVSDGKNRILEYRLFDLEGRQLNQQTFNNTITIDMSDLPAAAYVLQVSNESTMVKSFQIIKH